MSPGAAAMLAAASSAIDAGQLAQAEALCGQVIAAQPANGTARLLLARVRRLAGDFGEAALLAEAAARQMPKDPAPRLEAALAHTAAGRHAQAEAAARKALRLRPGFVPGLLVLAEVLTLAGRGEAALAEARRAAALAPGIYEARFAHANALFDAQRFEDAAAEFEAAGGLRPELTDPLYNRARALINLKRLAEAETVLRRCIALQPGASDAYENLAWILGEQNRFEELFGVCDLGISRCAQTGVLWQIKAEWHLVLGRANECLACYARAVEAAAQSDPAACALVRRGHALALLALGQYARGWREMRWREDRAALARRYDNFVADPSALPQDLSGKRVLIAQEQGLGDELFFLRYAPGLKARGASLLYAGEPKMHAILAARRDLFEAVLPPDARPAAIEFALLSGDLPEAAGGGLVPPLPLQPDEGLLDIWRQRLAQLGPPPYLGVTWRAGLAIGMSFRLRRPRLVKQVPVELLGAALTDVPGTVLVLQREPAPAELGGFMRALGRQAQDLSGLNERLDEMLALLRLLNEYVCVSNANTHFAASQGLACRVIAMRQPEWRWAAAGDASPWFPGIRLYRQQVDGGWTAPLGQLRKDLLGA